MLPPRLVLQDLTEFPFSFQKWLMDVQAYLVASGASGVIPATSGGTGMSSYTIGDLLYANTTTTLAALADVAVGQVLVSGGVGVARLGLVLLLFLALSLFQA